MAASLGWWQKFQSLFYPVSVRKSSSALNPVLELFYYQGRYLLATQDAIYSDGVKYRPLVKAFAVPELKEHLQQVKKVLVLGTGLASAVHILQAMGFQPHITLVEIDQLVLEWAMEFLPQKAVPYVTPIAADAFDFITTDTSSYDLIIVDMFFGREVPIAVTQGRFLKQCKARLAPNGMLVLNYMEQPGTEKGKAKHALQSSFAKLKELSFGINKVYVAGE